ncbi:hypothetical protein MMPV_002152 [Pyropia vietnamensis]
MAVSPYVRALAATSVASTAAAGTYVGLLPPEARPPGLRGWPPPPSPVAGGRRDVPGVAPSPPLPPGATAVPTTATTGSAGAAAAVAASAAAAAAAAGATDGRDGGTLTVLPPAMAGGGSSAVDPPPFGVARRSADGAPVAVASPPVGLGLAIPGRAVSAAATGGMSLEEAATASSMAVVAAEEAGEQGGEGGGHLALAGGGLPRRGGMPPGPRSWFFTDGLRVRRRLTPAGAGGGVTR